MPSLAKARGLGHKLSVGWRFATSGVWISVALAAIGFGVGLTACVEFGGPLVARDDADDADDADETGGDAGFERCGPSVAVVDRVIDGDTVLLTSGRRVRYILVDTPEITNGKHECWGTQASEVNAELVLGQQVTLTYDIECEDIYGRLLAYVEVGGVEVNRTLLERGDACVLHIPPNGNSRASEYRALELAAKQAGAGMWGACASVRCD
jgi:micrococcal nuclease